LQAEDKIVIGGVARLRDGMVVEPLAQELEEQSQSVTKSEMQEASK
jgi:hypothetical protein